jgi:hypothetical protein
MIHLLNTLSLGHRRGKDMVNGLTIIIERVKWRVIRGEFVTQTDGYNCGPIACLKLMELFQRIDLESSQKCYEKGRIRAIVLDEWKLLVDTCDKARILQVLDTRTEGTSVDKSEPSTLITVIHRTLAMLIMLMKQMRISLLLIYRLKLIFFLLKMRMVYSSGQIAHQCVSRTPTVMTIHATKDTKMFFSRVTLLQRRLCNFSSKNIPSRVLQQQGQETFITAQLFSVFKSQYHARNSRKGMNESLTVL